MQVCVRQQREITSALDSRIQLTLIVRLGTSQASRHDLAVFLHEVLQRLDVFVVDLFNASGFC
jgi:hypothetical protein